MARPLSELSLTDTGGGGDAVLLRTTVRAFVAAISALLITSLVVSRSGAALSVENATATIAVESGSISLRDDDQGRSLFNATDLVPGRASEGCITITYDGTILPVDVRLIAEVQGPLADYLDLRIDVGTGGGFDSCDGFVPSALLFDGTLAELGHRTATDPVLVGRLVNRGESRTVRFGYEVADVQEAVAKQAGASFVWESIPS